MTKQSPPSEMKDLRYVREGDVVDKARAWDGAQASYDKGRKSLEARCARLEKAAKRLMKATSDDAVMYEEARQAWCEMEAALSDTAQPDTWNPDHPNFGKTAPHE